MVGNVQLEQSVALGNLNLVSFIINSQSDTDLAVLAGLSAAASGITITSIVEIVCVPISNTTSRIMVFFT